MMKRLFKNYLLITVMAVLCLTMSVTASAETVTGECGLEGDNLIWSLDTETGILSIDGEGEMCDYNNPPWADYRDNIHTVTISQGVTSIGKSAFEECYRLEKVILPESIKTIGSYSFLCCLNLKEVVIPENIESIDTEAFVILPFLEKVTIESMNVNLSEFSLCANEFAVSGISREDFVDLFSRYYNGDIEYEEIEKYFEYSDDYIFIGTIYCHADSTAEAYAIENGVDYVLTHFFENEWTYDYDKMIRFRKCIHCDEFEIEPLERTEIGDVEIVEPEDTDTDFEVEKIEGDNFILIEETITDNLGSDREVLNAFDITLKNKDGVHVQPDGTVKVKLPLDWEKDGNYKVYRVNDDGTLTDMNAYRQGSHMVFETDHFSIYVIVEEGVQEDNEEPTTEEKSPLEFLYEIIDWFKDLINRITEFFRSIGDHS